MEEGLLCGPGSELRLTIGGGGKETTRAKIINRMLKKGGGGKIRYSYEIYEYNHLVLRTPPLPKQLRLLRVTNVVMVQKNYIVSV